MKKVENIMGMPITIEISKSANGKSANQDIEEVFDYFRKIDELYSPFKKSSQVGRFNRGGKISGEMDFLIKLAEKTRKETNGYFDIRKKDGTIDPSGIVKGWSIREASDILRKKGYKKFFVDAGGDSEIVGNFKWGIRNPFNIDQIVKVLNLENCGIATSGTYERGQHVWDPVGKKDQILDIVSLTVIGKNIYEADRFATAAFAMGKPGINFIEDLPGFEGYMIDKNGIATETSGLIKYL